MIKECNYCGHEYDAKRSDSKYCSNSCKNAAYLARKSSPTDNPESTNQEDTNGSRRIRRQNVKPSVSIQQNAFNSMINGLKTNNQMVGHLLSEKDTSGDLKALISKLEMKLLYEEQNYTRLKEKYDDLKESHDKLEVKLEDLGESKIDKLLNTCIENPSMIMGFVNQFGQGFKDGLASNSGQITGNDASTAEPPTQEQ